MLQSEGGVSVKEAQAIATSPQLRAALLTMPVLVTTKMKTGILIEKIKGAEQ